MFLVSSFGIECKICAILHLLFYLILTICEGYPTIQSKLRVCGGGTYLI
jgi:hypothetical protein